MNFPFEPPPRPTVPIFGSSESFPVHRIYCVGRNYAEHAREMGGEPEREPPFFFTKPGDAVLTGGEAAYPGRTRDLHHEIELVVALSGGARNVPASRAAEMVFGYAVGLDLTRRDIQAEAKKSGRPWDAAKGFDHSAPISSIYPAPGRTLDRGRITLTVNGDLRQSGDLSDLIWSIPEVIAELSTLFELRPGDLIFTGTPPGVASVRPGDELHGQVEGVGELRVTIGPPLA